MNEKLFTGARGSGRQSFVDAEFEKAAERAYIGQRFAKAHIHGTPGLWLVTKIAEDRFRLIHHKYKELPYEIQRQRNNE